MADKGERRGTPAQLLRIGGGLAIAGLLIVALAFRIVGLGHLPGINGDEAWYGVLAQAIASGTNPHWRTPSGNLPGPLQLGSLLILQTFFSPSFELLRLPAVASSVGAAGLAWWIVRRHFDRHSAVIALVLMAVLPVTIAYARFGWDPSHAPLVGLVSVAFALAGWRIACAAAFAVALVAHPTNIFIAPFLLFTLLGVAAERSGWRAALRWTAPALLLLVLALGTLSLTTSGGQSSVHPSAVVARIVDPGQWASFPLLFGRLLSGDTVYTYITGAGFGTGRRLIDFATLLILLGLIATGLWSLRRRAFGREAGIVTGWLASLLGFFLVAGPDSLAPHFERYAVCLIAPTVLAITLLAREIGGRGTRMASPLAVTGLIGALLLISFDRHYFVALEATGSMSHRTFWTGPVEPKEAALRTLLADPHPGLRPLQLVAEDWWLYWPVTYLAAGEPVRVIDGSTLAPGPLPRDRVWLVFAGGPLHHRLASTPGAVLVDSIAGTGRPSLLRIWWTAPDRQ
ncbi:MAG: hypothetical protein U1E21_05885 [Reyranellaceae bacterium]